MIITMGAKVKILDIVFNKKTMSASRTANKKFELMLTKRAKPYNSSCLLLSVYLHPFRRNSVLDCVLQPKIAKINKNFLGLFRKFRVF